MKNRIASIHNSIRKKLWTQSQNKQKELSRFIVEIHTRVTDTDNGQLSVLILHELSAEFDTAGGSLFLKYCVHLASKYFLLLSLLFPHWSLLPGIFSGSSTSLKPLALVCPRAQFSHLFLFTFTILPR